MSFQLGDIDLEHFISEYWRKKPLHIKNGSRFLLQNQLDRRHFQELSQRLERKQPDRVFRDPGVVFVQNVDVVSPELSRICQEQKRNFSCRRIWFDGVQADGGGTIGSHYDHSDNIILQQRGTKLWKLAPPNISDQELRRRMLEHRDVGQIDMPDDAYSFLVEEGDFLYMPLLWRHWGVSHGPSTSLSLVLVADQGLDLLAPPLVHSLNQTKAWWNPLPALAGEAWQQGTAEQRPPQVEAALDACLDAFGQAETRESIKQTWWKVAYGGGLEEDLQQQNAGANYKRSTDPIPAAKLGLDAEKFEFLGEELSIDTAKLGVPLKQALNNRGQAYRTLFLDIIQHSSGIFADSQYKTMLLWCAQKLGDIPAEKLSYLGKDAAFASWLFRVEECLKFSYLPRFEQLVQHLPSLLVSTFENQGIDWQDQSILNSVFRKTPEAFDPILAKHYQYQVADQTWSLHSGNHPQVFFGHQQLMLSNYHPWFSEHYPKTPRFGGRMIDAEVDLQAFYQAFLAGLAHLEAQAPAIYQDFGQLVQWIMPLKTVPEAPDHHCISAFPGFLLLAGDSPTEIAQSLAHETGRNKAFLCGELMELLDDEGPRQPEIFGEGDCSPDRYFADWLGLFYQSQLPEAKAAKEKVEQHRRGLQTLLTPLGQEFLKRLG